MSDTSTIQSAAGAATTTATTASTRNVIGKDEFLKMLIAQLKHQDPMNPMDGTAFTAQLAQFSSLEQLQNINTQLTSFTRQQQSLGNTQAVNLIGREVLAKGDTIQAEGTPVDLQLPAQGRCRHGPRPHLQCRRRAGRCPCLQEPEAGLEHPDVEPPELHRGPLHLRGERR